MKIELKSLEQKQLNVGNVKSHVPFMKFKRSNYYGRNYYIYIYALEWWPSAPSELQYACLWYTEIIGCMTNGHNYLQKDWVNTTYTSIITKCCIDFGYGT